MDLLSSIRKEGSRGGVDFKWSDVTTSTHRENYLGHSLMAPVGRWQKNKDLNWYAKADDIKTGPDGETAEQKRIRERKEEIRLIKEAEEDALAKALGLPVKDRTLGANGQGSGANAVDVGEMKRVIKETEEGDDEIGEVGLQRGFGNFVGKVDGEKIKGDEENNPIGGLIRKEGGKRSDHKSSRRRTDEHRSSRRRRDDDRSPRRRYDEDRSSRRYRDEDQDSRRGHRDERSSRRYQDDEGRDSQRNNSSRRDGRDEPRGGDHWRHRSHSPIRQERRYRSRTPEKRDRRKDERPDSRRGRDTIKRES